MWGNFMCLRQEKLSESQPCGMIEVELTVKDEVHLLRNQTTEIFLDGNNGIQSSKIDVKSYCQAPFI